MNRHAPASVVSAVGVAKRYGADTVFASVSLDVAAGEFVAIVGDSGVGKSTLLNGLAGLDKSSLVLRSRRGQAWSRCTFQGSASASWPRSS